MPELPEVETVRRGVEPHITGKTLEAVEVLDPRLRRPVDADAMQSLAGRRVESVSRRSKYLIFEFADQNRLILHLGMSGRIRLAPPGSEREKHTHLVFLFPDIEMQFRDPRRFGMAEVVRPEEWQNYPRFQNLGLEPLSDAFQPASFFEICRRKQKPIKNLLMDQNIVVGIGNIYANEALAVAGIDPRQPAARLDIDQTENVVKSVKTVLEAAIAKGGTTLSDHQTAFGEPGFFQLELLVYGKDETPCKTCGSPIVKTTLAGRSTFYCPVCQT